MHPNGQLPAYEWEFGDVNPPVHAWAAWHVYRIDGYRDREFLVRQQDTADDATVVKSVQETLQRAQQNLEKVNYQALNPGAKAQHDTARRFIAQAQDALKSRRLDFARYLADKADRLSASLLSR